MKSAYVSFQVIIFDELIQSARKIENKLGYFPKSISYPLGSFNQNTLKIVKEAGYNIGLAVGQNPIIPQKTVFMRYQELNFIMSRGGKQGRE